jgi:hypothetical protein
MSRFGVGFVSSCALVLALGALTASIGSASAAPTREVSVRVAGLDRAGKDVSVSQASLVPASGFPYFYQGSSISVPAGRYLVGAEVPTYSGRTIVSETLVVRQLTISSGGTIRLDARHGKLVRVALRGVAASQQSLTAGACMYTPGDGDGASADAIGGPGVSVYVVPMRSSLVSFAYTGQFQAGSGATYFLTGSSGAGLPSRLQYQQDASRLARVTVELRTGIDPGSAWTWSIAPAGKYDPFFCGPGFGNFQAAAPVSAVGYVTPGPWVITATVAVNSDNHAAYLTRQAVYAARHSYADVFGGAVVGPVNSFPMMGGFTFDFGPALFEDSAAQGSYCCSATQVALRSGSRVLKRETVRGNASFLTQLRDPGWYELTARSQRSLPGGTPAAGLLSSEVTMSWRFHAAWTEDWTAFPVTETVFQAGGLDLANEASSLGRTILKIRVERPADQGNPTPVYRLTTMRVEASANGGKSWQVLKLTRHGSYWTAAVADPASGYVALRSIVADAHGDRTVQTIYRAYAIGP